MAERRMFAKGAVKMLARLSVEAKALYFYIGMEADDDGFCDGLDDVAVAVGLDEDEQAKAVGELVKRGMLLLFRDGTVACVVNWRQNNEIKSDRYHPTKYQAEKDTLILEENARYVPMSQNYRVCIHKDKDKGEDKEEDKDKDKENSISSSLSVSTRRSTIVTDNISGNERPIRSETGETVEKSVENVESPVENGVGNAERPVEKEVRYARNLGRAGEYGVPDAVDSDGYIRTSHRGVMLSESEYATLIAKYGGRTEYIIDWAYQRMVEQKQRQGKEYRYPMRFCQCVANDTGVEDLMRDDGWMQIRGEWCKV